MVGLALARLGGRRGAALAARADIVRFTGPAYARRRVKEERELAERAPAVAVYARIWHEAAAAVGAEAKVVGPGRYELRRGDRSTTVELHVTALDPPDKLALALDRRRSAARLREAGVPIPQQTEFTLKDRGPAERLIAEHGAIVVKPGEGTSGGDGITANVRTGDELVRAAIRAARAGATLVAEQHLDGEEYRLLFLDGELLDVIRRRPPAVTGDGGQRLGDLVAAENRRRLDAHGEDGLKLVTIDLDAVHTLRANRLTLGSVPARDERVAIKHLASQAGRRDSERADRTKIGEELVQQCQAAGEALGLRLYGVDLLATDMGGMLLEVNGTPGLHYHEHVASDPLPTPVAVPILSHLLS